ncbi:MAG: hypothetical protein O8C61_05690 [Candidatus Methanoperedens sp.]|nr:hypothetical protein [Candidatus Methanoperedens sp.]
MTSASKDVSILKENIMEQKKHIREGFKRIEKYYTSTLDKRKAETGLSEPPHEILLERSAIIIGLELDSFFASREECERFQGGSEPVRSVFGRGWLGFDYILIGVGTEILLKAIVLKIDPNFIIKDKDFDKQITPSFDKCKKKLISHLRSKKLSPTHLERVEDILELIQLKRNNLAHLNFHNLSDYKEESQVANVLKFLFLYFFKANSFKIVEKLDKVLDETKVSDYVIDYELVKFDEHI